MFKLRKTVGIDLGTTNSVIALLDPTDSSIFTGRDEQGRAIFPSVVGYAPEAQRLVVGHAADALKNGTALPVSSVKRFMGLNKSFAVGPERLTPPEVSARVLTLMREVMARTLQDSRYLLDSAVITMPAYFNHNQIEDTREAGELAGYEVVELLHEPTAAAMYYSWVEGHGDAAYLVYDLGGGTFDVSVIRKRYGDYEVLGVSGDPFLGGDDFDRLLATFLSERSLCPAAEFAQLVHAAERIKIALSSQEEASGVRRADFNRLIKDKIDRTIDCCHEALARAKERAGVRLGDIDHVILVGGSSRIPLVRDTVRTAFCNPSLPEHARNPEPLLHEPDLCVAYGAALRASTHGTRYLFPNLPRARSFLPDLDLGLGLEEPGLDLELHLTSPVNVRESTYTLTGCVRGPGVAEVRHGGSVRVTALATGSEAEAFLEAEGGFACNVELKPETDNVLELALLDNGGRELVRAPVTIRHSSQARALGAAVLATQLVTKPLSIEVLDRQRRRIKQVIAPIGAPLPGIFRCTCRTVDQAGRVVVPIFEENRVIKQMVLADLDPTLPVGSPVDVELAIDVKHTIQVRVLVREAGRSETATVEGPPPPDRPTREAIDAVLRQIEQVLPTFSGGFRARVRSRVERLKRDLDEALRYDDEPKAIQRMAELRDVLDQLTYRRGQALDPPWARFEQLVKDCLHLAGAAAESSRRDRAELERPIHEQRRYAEQAYEEENQALYRQTWDRLERYAGQLGELLREHAPPPEPQPWRSPAEEARAAVEYFRGHLAKLWKEVRSRGCADLEPRLTEVANQAKGLNQRAKDDPPAAVREVRRLMARLAKVGQRLDEMPSKPRLDDSGLLEGSG